MYEHKILCFLEYEEDDDEDDDDEEKWKKGYFIQIVKKTATSSNWRWWGNFCRHLRWNNDTVCLYSNNKIILFGTHIVGYFIY